MLGRALAAAIMLSATAARPRAPGDDVQHLLRLSEGRGRDTQCIEPPPPLDNVLRSGSAAAHHRAAVAVAAPPHLKYLGLDGSTDLNESSWTNLGFWAGTNATALQ